MRSNGRPYCSARTRIFNHDYPNGWRRRRCPGAAGRRLKGGGGRLLVISPSLNHLSGKIVISLSLSLCLLCGTDFDFTAGIAFKSSKKGEIRHQCSLWPLRSSVVKQWVHSSALYAAQIPVLFVLAESAILNCPIINYLPQKKIVNRKSLLLGWHGPLKAFGSRIQTSLFYKTP